MAGSGERQIVLKMLEEGRISVEEAEELLGALERAERSQGPEAETRAEGERGSDQPELDFGEIGRGIRDAVRGLTERLQKLTEATPWGRDLGEWFRSALGGSRSTVERPLVFPPGPVDRIVVKGTNGKVTARPSAQEPPSGTARITGWGTDEGASRGLAEEIRVFTTVREGTLELSYRAAEAAADGAPTERFEVDLELRIPDAAALEVTTTSGDVELTDLAGEITLHTASGSVRLNGVRGKLAVSTSSGDLRGEQIGSDRTEIRTSSGDVVLTLAPSPGVHGKITTSSGDVVLRLAPGANVRLEASTASGEVTVRAPLRVEELSRSRFVGVQGQADGTIQLSSSSGDLRIESPGS